MITKVLFCRTKTNKLPWRGPLDDDYDFQELHFPKIRQKTPKNFDWDRYEDDFRNASARKEKLRDFKG